MLGLLTWPAYGSWLPGPARGNTLAGRSGGQGVIIIEEPDREASERRRRGLKWPAVRLTLAQQRIVLDDLHRIARLRGFVPVIAVAAADHVHVLLDADPACDIHRLIQLTKGALSRALSVEAGDRPAESTGGVELPHHKWWTRQYAFRWLRDEAEVEALRRALPACGGREATVRADWSGDAWWTPAEGREP